MFSPEFGKISVFRRDLEAAGIAYADASGEVADFHSLRKTYGTMLTLTGVPQRVVMELMRHSDMKLTEKIYTDSRMLPVREAVAKLPTLTQSIIQDSQIDSQKLCPTGPEVCLVVPAAKYAKCSGSSQNQGLAGNVAPSVPSSPLEGDGARYRVRT